MDSKLVYPIKALIGLGNPGRQYANTRHNIGFMVLDALAKMYQLEWKTADLIQYTKWTGDGHSIWLIKPQTHMNDSGKIAPWISKKGMGAENILVIHDELEKPFGSVALKIGGSARGHNGLRSLIESFGPEFARVRVGIGRPASPADVPDYVLEPFENMATVESAIKQAIELIKQTIGYNA